MTLTDKSYFLARAGQEREAARNADKRQVAEIHLDMACQYEKLAGVAELRPTSRTAE